MHGVHPLQRRDAVEGVVQKVEHGVVEEQGGHRLEQQVKHRGTSLGQQPRGLPAEVRLGLPVCAGHPAGVELAGARVQHQQRQHVGEKVPGRLLDRAALVCQRPVGTLVAFVTHVELRPRRRNRVEPQVQSERHHGHLQRLKERRVVPRLPAQPSPRQLQGRVNDLACQQQCCQGGYQHGPRSPKLSPRNWRWRASHGRSHREQGRCEIPRPGGVRGNWVFCSAKN
mmetsp:Transcript_1231/g.4826  ORF Transcript_1231/g.4826 Transcript_1231/m.4826 type:complete len:226 (-) Transcript_1231:1536-2213(-)